MTPSAPLGDDRLIEVVLQALDASDPLAALRAALAGSPGDLARGERLLQQYGRLAELDAVALVGAEELPPDPEDPAQWPAIPNVALEGVLGRGGQGLVLRGRQTYLDRPVAVKLLAPELQTPAFLERFRREARLLARLRHPHIVACHDAGVAADGRCYLVMELVEGPNLAQHSARQGALGRTTALRLVRELATALQYAAAAGLVHRDVKPENVLLAAEPDGGNAITHLRAKLADLGLARPMEQREGYTLLTPVGAVVGTPVTMAPEQFDGPERVDERADMYGLGCVLHLALTGTPAFRAGSLSEALVQKLALRDAGGKVSLRGVREDDGTPTTSTEVAALAALVSRLLAWDPATRPSTYDELIAALDARSAATSAPPAKRRVHKWTATVTGLVLGYLLWRGPRTTTPSEPEFEPTGSAELAAPPQPATPQPSPTEGTTPIAPTPRTRTALFPAEDLLAGWTVAVPRPFAVDESRRGALVNAARVTAHANRALPTTPFTVRGVIEARARYVSAERPRVPVAEVRVRFLLGADEALSLALLAQDEAAEQLELRWQRESRKGDVWQVSADIADTQTLAVIPVQVPFWMDWDGALLRVAAGPEATAEQVTGALSLPSEDTSGAAPRALEVTVRGGVAVLTDWFIEIAQPR